MQSWQTTYLGTRELPRDISAFEMQAFFTFEPCLSGCHTHLLDVVGRDFAA